MNTIARLTLLAYPRAFRRRFGEEYLRTVADLRRAGGRGRIRIVGRLLGDAMTVAPYMRWENLMAPVRVILIVATAVVALAGMVMGSQATVVFVAGVLVLALLGLAGKDRPIATAGHRVTRYWYWWLLGAAGAFLVGSGVLAVAEEDGGLSEMAWTAWMLSWSSAVVLALIGIVLGATRLLTNRHHTAHPH